MKLIKIIFFFLIITINANACSCIGFPDSPISAEIAARYDFIAHIRIKAVRTGLFFRDTSTNRSDFARIEILELFKGEKVDSIHIWGIGSSCDMGMQKDNEWIVYANKFETSYSTNMCTHSVQLLPKSWQTDMPFFLTPLFLLQKYFNHPLPKLKNGIHETFFPDERLKSRYIVSNHKLEGTFYYRSNQPGIVYNYQFKDGVMNGNAYKIGLLHKWIFVSKYNHGELTENIEYTSNDSIGVDINLTNRLAIDSSIQRQKAFQFQELFLPDKSVIKKTFHKNNTLNRIEQKDFTGKILFSIRYSDTGILEGNELYEPITGITTYIGYYPTGAIERKLIWQPDKKQTSYFYNIDGTLKTQGKK